LSSATVVADLWYEAITKGLDKHLPERLRELVTIILKDVLTIPSSLLAASIAIALNQPYTRPYLPSIRSNFPLSNPSSPPPLDTLLPLPTAHFAIPSTTTAWTPTNFLAQRIVARRRYAAQQNEPMDIPRIDPCMLLTGA
jgi:hypothetical protein